MCSIQKERDASSEEIINLFWTGGWDSTFRLLEVVFIEKKVVKPHYVIRPQECTGKEIDTIHKIIRKISREYPKIRRQIKPVSYININNVNEHKKITAEYEKIVESKRLSSQYEKLARYCHQIGVSSMELCVLNKEKFKFFISNTSFFKYFDFPILGFTKEEIAQISENQGWMDIMRMTWFCRRPNNGVPCGFCGPCTDVLIGGVGWRLPLWSRIKASLQLPFRTWWRNNYKKQSKGVLKYIPKLLKGKY